MDFDSSVTQVLINQQIAKDNYDDIRANRAKKEWNQLFSDLTNDHVREKGQDVNQPKAQPQPPTDTFELTPKEPTPFQAH